MSLFSDITHEAALDFVHEAGIDSGYAMPQITGSGGGFLDYDNDGDLDIYLVNGSRSESASDSGFFARNRLFRQEDDGTFTDVTDASGLGDAGYGMGIAAGDMDNDGNTDIYVTNVGSDALYRNNGDGTFSDVTLEAGIANLDWGTSVVFFDLDVDGFLDIYVANYLQYDSSVVCTDEAGRRDYCGPQIFTSNPDVIYRNNGNGTFTDVSDAAGISRISSKGLGVVSADFNDDGYPDIYVANDGEPNYLWINQGDGTFEEEALILGAAVNMLGRAEAGMGIGMNDLDNDGDWDLFVTHLRGESNTLYRNVGGRAFQDDASASRLGGISIPFTGFGTGFLDFDNDGDLDLAVVNGRVTRGPLLDESTLGDYWAPYAEPNLLFENEGAGLFRDVSESVPALSEHPENSRGLALGDVDNDGDVDLLVTTGGGRARLLRNDTRGGHWLLVRAFDPALRRDAFGSRVSVTAGDRQYHRIVTPGYSFLSTSDPRVHFGLGNASGLVEVVVRWPDDTRESFGGIEIDRIVTLEKGSGVLIDE